MFNVTTSTLALLISTFVLGLEDKRLFTSSFEWLVQNGEWLNLSRLKRIVELFIKPFPGSEVPLVNPEAFNAFLEKYNKLTRGRITFQPFDSWITEENLIKEYKKIFNNFKLRDVVIKPRIQHRSLLQLLLRSVFGVNAHVEILIYLLAHESGNSNSIAKEVFYNQKNVHTILARWTQAQIVIKISEKKAAYYFLRRRKEFLGGLGLKEVADYLNWTRTFLLLGRLAKALSSPGLSQDEYLLSSLFRDYLNEAKSLGLSLKIAIPDPDLYPGKRYFAPFATALLSILRELKKFRRS